MAKKRYNTQLEVLDEIDRQKNRLTKLQTERDSAESERLALMKAGERSDAFMREELRDKHQRAINRITDVALPKLKAKLAEIQTLPLDLGFDASIPRSLRK